MDGIMRDNGGSNLPLSQTCLYTELDSAKMARVGLLHSSCVLTVWLRLSLVIPSSSHVSPWLQKVSTSRMLLHVWESCELKLDVIHLRSVRGTLIYLKSCPLLLVNMKFCPKCWYNVQQDGIAKLGYKWHICPKCGHHLARLDYSPF